MARKNSMVWYVRYRIPPACSKTPYRSHVLCDGSATRLGENTCHQGAQLIGKVIRGPSSATTSCSTRRVPRPQHCSVAYFGSKSTKFLLRYGHVVHELPT